VRGGGLGVRRSMLEGSSSATAGPDGRKASAIVAAQLRRRIIRGELGEGDALPNETELTEEYRVSRPTVREALRILESESLISVKRGTGGGARVRLPEASVTARHAALFLQARGTTLRDVFDARELIEPAAVRRLAERRPARALAELNTLHELELSVLNDPVAYPMVAAQFHEKLIELSGNQTLTLIGRLLLEIVEVHNRATFARRIRTERLARVSSVSHATLLDLIGRGEADSAEQFWRQHVEDGARYALRTLGPATVVDLLDEA
jgi:DNA-binding FadR family transcriptional regulator